MIRSVLEIGKPRRFCLRNVFICLCIVVGLAGMPAGCQDAMSQLGEAQRLAVDMRLQLNRAAAASVRAVMAKTDADSITFAREAEQARQTLKKDTEAMLPLLRVLTYTKEVQLLEEFNRHFAEYEAIDRRILELAVENTNLKAQQLSLGLAQEAADALRAALDTMASLASPKNRCRVDSLMASAALAVREIQVLQAAHIAEQQHPTSARHQGEHGECEHYRSLGRRRKVAEQGAGCGGAVAALVDSVNGQGDRTRAAGGIPDARKVVVCSD